MFTALFNQYNWHNIKDRILQKVEEDVMRALNKGKRNLEDFMALISPAALPHLETMAKLSHNITQKRFGKTIQMYAPLYLSNECQNICTYCAFSLDNKIKRKTLNNAEMLIEAQALKAMGYDHVLLVTGEANTTVGVPYMQNAIKLLRPLFANISIEVQPLLQEEYALLIEEGLYSVLVYQETYNKEKYKIHHPKGKKSNFNFRLETPDRLGKANVHKIGLGVLIGLEDWRTDSFYTALHLKYLQRQYWQSKYSVSFPRLRPIELAAGDHTEHKSFHNYMSDKELVQLICAYRLLDEDLEISISTREEELFRNNIIKLGVTSMSAGSKTNPGGYAVAPQTLEQFEISDERTPDEIAAIIRKNGYEPVWKDWDKAYSH